VLIADGGVDQIEQQALEQIARVGHIELGCHFTATPKNAWKRCNGKGLRHFLALVENVLKRPITHRHGITKYPRFGPTPWQLEPARTTPQDDLPAP
jgi:hypothetical protein